jgi:hypothetical protein
VYPLVRNAQAMLAGAFLHPALSGGRAIVDLNQVEIEGDGGLLEVLKQLEDPRKPRGVRHTHTSVLAMGICACLSGMKSFVAIAQWTEDLPQDLLERLGCRYDYNLARYVAPSEPTMRRVLQSVDAAEVDRRVGGWLASKSSGRGLAVDGKALRGSADGDGKPLHLLSALLHDEAVVVGQQAVSEKSNEITAMKPLLEPLSIEGKVVTADAMHAQRDHARYIVEEKKADYLFTVKANQPGLLNAIADLAPEDFFPCVRGDQ